MISRHDGAAASVTMSDRIEEVVVTTAPASGPLPWEFRETVDMARPAEEVFAFVTQPENVPRDQLLLQIRGAVAEYEHTLIAERMRRGRQARLRAGTLLLWTRVPFGYRLDPERPGEVAGVRSPPTRPCWSPSCRPVPATAGDLVPVRRADAPHVPEEGGGGV
jgi:Resolvase, N terminal domain